MRQVNVSGALATRPPPRLQRIIQPLASGVVAALGVSIMQSTETWEKAFIAAAVTIFNSLRLRKAAPPREKERAPKLERPPLALMNGLLRFLTTRKLYERVFAPAMADIFYEWQVAHVAGELRRAWYIKHILGRAIVIWHILSQVPVSIGAFLGKLLLKLLSYAMP